ncbi:hypothetical protein [Bacillus subtilis]|uniref:Uncharacterized protein n=1 Tax=Bacillus subtilis (strain 168) TaxID=224308 RepID=A0A6M4JHN8_BACSU|nr:hypothetical protein [Bacillus subtilis]APD21324.1 hypothetical protein phi3T_181 [Bacillus phage phi3T]QNN96765.1 hypothetical protein [Bacillus phage phi3Ts]QNN96953.1 hypothetical protein [Bacillus phage Hyb2phi3Ts-SPbeta]QNN97138.1 hypothetical protein [Bacillus phage Hyb3phi3Ts-SPbeta]QNR51670.1 hypothetical protein [Bacillus phage Hyb1phi3Ts-SPbeta]
MEAGDKIHNANEKIAALKKKKYKFETMQLETQRELLRLETQQNKEKLEILFELGEILNQIVNEEWVSSTIATKIINRNRKAYRDLFLFRENKAYINKEKFKELNDQFIHLTQKLNDI